MSEFNVSSYDRRSTDRPGRSILARFLHNVRVLFGQSAWMLIAPVVTILWFIDHAMVKTMAQWTLMAAAVAGFTLIITGIMLPSIKVSELLPEVRKGNVAAAIVGAAFLIFMVWALQILAGWS